MLPVVDEYSSTQDDIDNPGWSPSRRRSSKTEPFATDAPSSPRTRLSRVAEKAKRRSGRISPLSDPDAIQPTLSNPQTSYIHRNVRDGVDPRTSANATPVMATPTSELASARSAGELSRIRSDMSEALREEIDVEDEKPVRCQNFRQQNMWALKPVWSPKCIMIMYFIVAIVFIPVGTVVLVQSLQMMRTDSVRYDDIELCDIGETSSTTTVNTCVIPINITKETKAPSYMYYGLVNYFQNARRYIDSRSAEQLRGQANPDTGLCKSDIGEEIAEAVPCGLTAFSMFNDTFDLCRDEECDALVDLKKEGIAWDVDRDVRFLPGEIGTEDGYTEESNALVTDEDFMVWMRVAAYNNFHKLYRIVEEDLEPGVYYVRVNASYPVSGFGGEKFVYISETRWFGGRSRFLGGSYLAIGVLALLMATFILVRVQRMPEDKLPPATDVPAEGYDEDDLQAPPDARSSELDNGGTATDRLAKEVGASPSTYTHASG